MYIYIYIYIYIYKCIYIYIYIYIYVVLEILWKLILITLDTPTITRDKPKTYKFHSIPLYCIIYIVFD